jgi:hypothetical protein
MGQQQILFILLAICILGIGTSIGVISLSGYTLSDNRTSLEQDLRAIAARMQECANPPLDREGLELSPFVSMRRSFDVLKTLGCPSSNAHGDFFVKKGHNPACIQIVGVGVERGYDGKRPVRMMITVWANRTSLVVLN